MKQNYLTLFIGSSVVEAVDWEVPFCNVRESECAGNRERLLEHYGTLKEKVDQIKDIPAVNLNKYIAPFSDRISDCVSIFFLQTF